MAEAARPSSQLLHPARVLVVTEPDHDQVVAYYAWAMASIVPTEVPARLRKGAGRHPSPLRCSLDSGSRRRTREEDLGPPSFRM